MSKLIRIRNRMEDDNEVNMVPIMNMFLVLIPFLLMSASFLHLKAINTSIPILGNTDNKSIKQLSEGNEPFSRDNNSHSVIIYSIIRNLMRRYWFK